MENRCARIRHRFRLALTANNGAIMLTLFADELAFIRADLHSLVAGSH
jgi:hypothetical protein